MKRIKKSIQQLFVCLLFAFSPNPMAAQSIEMTTPFTWSRDQAGTGIDITASGDNPFALRGLSGAVEVNGSLVRLKDARVLTPARKGVTSRLDFVLPGIGCRWSWEVVSIENGLEIIATLHNTGKTPLSVGKWDVVSLSAALGQQFKAGDDPGSVRFFRWRPWDMRVELLESDGGKHWSDNLFLLYDQPSGQSFVSAFLTMDRMQCRHSVVYSSAGGIESYKATCSFGDYILQPGQQLVSEKLRISFQTDPFRALEGWAERIRAIKQPVFADLPPVGLGSGAWIDTWNEQEGGYAEVSLDDAKAMRAKLKGFEVDIFRVSTFSALKEGIPGNWLLPSERHFAYTNGYANFLKQMLDLGFKPGVWVAPFWFLSEADGALEENRDNLLLDKNGTPITEVINWAGDLGDVTPLTYLHKYSLDGTHPKTAEYIRKVFAKNRELGVRFYMLDFLDVPKNARLHDPTQTPLQAANNILQLIRKTAGTDTHLQTAVSSTPAFTGLINAARVGRDFGEGRPMQGAPLSDWRNASYVLHDEHYANLFYLLQNAAASYFTHRKLYINDLNELTIDKPVPLEHARVATTIFGMCGTPLMLGDDFRRISDERLQLVKMCLPRTSDMPVPVDLFEHVFPGDYSRYLKLPVSTVWDNYQVVAVFNLDQASYNAELDFGKLGLDNEKPYRVYEFWNENYCGTYRERYKMVIPPNSCRLFRISEARNYPWLLSTDMHIQQGAVEVESLKWDPERKCLSGTVTRPAGQTGNLYFLMPRKMRVINDKGLFLMKELEDMNVVIRKEIKFTKDHESFEIFFEPWEEKYVTAKPLLPYATEAQWLEYVRKHRSPGDTRVIE
jgi:hypothetical protein